MKLFWAALAIGIILILNLGGCAQNGSVKSVSQSTSSSLQLAKKSAWLERSILPLGPDGFEIFSLRNLNKPMNGVLNIYIEGDGHVWDRGIPSADPTPIKAVALEMALEQPSGAVAYLARPCQFVGVGKNVNCTPIQWNDRRFSAEAVADLNHAVDVLKLEVGAQRVRLIGYSGGGAISLLIGINRSDVVGVVTVAGNLDIDAWAKYHHLPMLRGSLNPASYISQTQGLPQIHFVGTQDQIIPPRLTQDFVKRYASNMPVQIITIENVDHACCWAEQWPSLWKQVVKE